MTATTLALTGIYRIEAGATYDVTIPIVDEQGDPIDLTDYDPNATPAGTGCRMMLRQTIDEVTTELLALDPVTATLTEGVYIVQPPTLGKVRIFILPATSSALSFDAGAPIPENRSGVYDLEAEGQTVGDVLRLLEGPFLIDPEATR